MALILQSEEREEPRAERPDVMNTRYSELVILTVEALDNNTIYLSWPGFWEPTGQDLLNAQGRSCLVFSTVKYLFRATHISRVINAKYNKEV